MRHQYDNYGWYMGTGTGQRTTEIAPANTSIDETEGLSRSNWTGYEWIELPYVKPPESVIVDPVPEAITPRQAKIALLHAGLLDDVETAISAIPDETTRRIAQIEWEYAQEVRRDWPLLVAVAGQMGLADEQVDDLFRIAANI